MNPCLCRLEYWCYLPWQSEAQVEDKQLKRGLTLVMVLLFTAIIVVHHVTSYALVIFLIVLSTVYSYLQVHSKSKQPNTWGFAIAALG